MKKKILFISIGALALGALVLLLLFVSRNKPGGQNNQPSTSESAELPTRTENSQQNIQNVKATIKDVAESPASSQAMEKGFEVIKFKDASGNKIPLADFKKNAGITVTDQLNTYLDSKSYDLFYCVADGNKKEYAIYFGYNIDKAYANLNPDTFVWMKNWEKTMFSDLHTVLFPGVDFSKEELDQPLQFKDGHFRYAEVRLPDDKMGSINYRVSLNGVIASSSLSCLEKMVEIYEPLEP